MPDYKTTAAIGHPGEDWGSNSKYNGYNPKYNFSIAITMNSVIGMNCTGMKYPDVFTNWGQGEAHSAPCFMMDAALQFFSEGQAPRLECGGPG